MKLIGLEDHRFLVLHSDHHCDMVKITIGQQSLHFGSEMFGVEKQDVSSLRSFQELFLSEDVFMQIFLFIHRLQHQFLIGFLEINNSQQSLLPLDQLISRLRPEYKILALPLKIKVDVTLLGYLQLSFQQFQIGAAQNLCLFGVIVPHQFFGSQHHVAFLNDEKFTVHLKKKPSVFCYSFPYFSTLLDCYSFGRHILLFPITLQEGGMLTGAGLLLLLVVRLGSSL